MATVQARPGGRSTLEFGPGGYAAVRERLRGRLGRWGHQMFRDRTIFAALGLAILLALVAMPFVKDDGASDTTKMTATAPAVACLCYCLLGITVRVIGEGIAFLVGIVTLPLLVFPRYRRLLFGTKTPVEQRKEFVHADHIAQSHERRDGDHVTVTVRFTNGAQVDYTAKGRDGQTVSAGFTRLLGPRHIRT